MDGHLSASKALYSIIFWLLLCNVSHFVVLATTDHESLCLDVNNNKKTQIHRVKVLNVLQEERDGNEIHIEEP